ncbi:Gldg family protein [Acidobacteria bacterium AH-259-D05]|nr:Gldg family protein [Acidobacteria bacterium AH-259-D05]
MSSRINLGFIQALVKRDLWKYFTNPTGYVFITLFIFLSAATAFWQDRFFLDNLANLNQLNRFFPYLLVFFIPALSMPVWAEEKKQGTDELLLTLPATSLEVVLGKYLATLGIYTISLLLSLSHVLVLLWLGKPDLGLMFSNYVGYWLIGSSLITVGMLASLLTSNATIAFILGTISCSFLVFTKSIFYFSETFRELLVPLGVFGHFADFSRGVMSLSGVLYFVLLAAMGLYLNVLLLERQHWPREADGYPMWSHHLVRTAALMAALVSMGAIISRASLRLDVTAEGLHSLSSETHRLIRQLPEDRPVFIQAYISPEIPEQFVQTRENLLGLLNEINAIGGAKVQVLIEETEPFTQASRDAREKFGIIPRQVPNLGSARASFSEVFLGVAFTSGAQEQVIPFLDRGLPTEYEIIRSIRVVAGADRKKIGVLNTEVKLFGGLDFQTMQTSPSWSVVEELKKQYEVVQISPFSPIPDDLDGLLVALPSSLSQEGMDQLLSYIEEGHPTLLLIDPLPVVNIALAPTERAGANMNPLLRQQAAPPPEKGNIQQLLSKIGVSWNSSSIVWDSYNPHPDLAQLPTEVVFVGRGNENPETFNETHQASSDLQELVLLYPGQIQASESAYDFQPLLKSGYVSGILSYFQMVQRSFLGVQLNSNLPHLPDDQTYVLAAHITAPQVSTAAEETSTPDGTDPEAASAEEGSDSEESSQKDAPPTSPQPLNIIVIADLDFISEQFFLIRAQGPENLNFDNVTFFLNAIDVLVGEESFLNLRNKRIQHRTLERVEQQTQNFIEERVQKEQDAEAEAQQALTEAQARLEEKVNEVRQRTDLDAQTKQIMARNLQEVENRRFEVLKTNIEAEKEAKISESKENMEEQIRRIQENIKTFAVLLPPIPVFALGVFIFLRRQRREREGAAAARRLRH